MLGLAKQALYRLSHLGPQAGSLPDSPHAFCSPDLLDIPEATSQTHPLFSRSTQVLQASARLRVPRRVGRRCSHLTSGPGGPKTAG